MDRVTAAPVLCELHPRSLKYAKRQSKEPRSGNASSLCTTTAESMPFAGGTAGSRDLVENLRERIGAWL